MKEWRPERITVFIIAFSLILIYLTDGLSKFLLANSSLYTTILPNRFVKILLIIFSIICTVPLIKKYSKQISKVYFLLISLIVIYIINYFLYDLNFEYLLKYSCFFYFTPMFFFKGEDELWARNVDSVFKYLIYINFVLIIVGILCDFQLFKTYYTRFGYNGLLLTPMQSTYFYISAICIALNRKSKLFFVISVLSALLIGTKILLGFLVCLGVWMIFNRIKNNKTKTVLIFSLVSSFLLAFWSFFSQEVFKNIIDSQGLLSAIFSFRNEALVSVWKNLPQINYNLITGGVNLFKHRVEMEFIDAFLCFGLLGIIIFFLLFKVLKNCFVVNKITLFYFSIVLFFILMAGNFLYYPINCFLFLITLKSLGIKHFAIKFF